jgi:hypothetical protein
LDDALALSFATWVSRPPNNFLPTLTGVHAIAVKSLDPESSSPLHFLIAEQLPPFNPVTMPALDLIDHSPQQPDPAPPLANASNVVVIDNFDSFTWNIYQYLVLEGATVTVFRNDAITVEELSALNPTQLVISPGPGHPKTDSGISRDAIQHFAGKIPILGVCMGQ